jgi:hypothetical protein
MRSYDAPEKGKKSRLPESIANRGTSYEGKRLSMTKRTRKRYNPLEEKSLPLEESKEMGSVAAIGMETPIREGQVQVERIERLRPSQMLPDRFQPRRMLPDRIRRRFFRNEIDCYQAAREWLAMAKDDQGWKARVQELLDMGDSFEEQGQIKPITGTWIPSQDGGYVFKIETGERRFWAACLLAVKEKAKEEPELRVEAIYKPTRKRQVLENRHAQSPSAVSQACEVASLMLEEMEVEPDPALDDEYDYFKKAIKKRAPRGLWPKLEPVMQYSTRRMQQLLAILQLPTPLLELADRHRVPERVLREILALPDDQWEVAINLATKDGITSEDVAGLAEKTTKPRKRDDALRSPERIAYSGLRRFTRATMNVDEDERDFLLDGVADEVVVQGFGEELIPLLEGLQERLEARLKGLL